METVDVYVDTPEDLDSFAKTLSTLMGLTMTRDEGGYSFAGNEVWGWVNEHDLVKDGDLDFPSFPLDVAFCVGTEDRLPARDRLARQVFEALKAAGRYGVMLVFDDQTKLDEFRPARSAAQSAA